MKLVKYWSQYTSIKQFESMEENDSLWDAIRIILAASALTVFVVGVTFIGLSL